MKTSIRLVEPAVSYACEAANDNQRGHTAPVIAKAKSGKLFQSLEENILAIQTINRLDAILAAAESDPTYTRAEEGQFSRRSVDDEGDYIGQSVTTEVAGRSAEKILDDFTNGIVACFEPRTVRLPDGPEGPIPVRDIANLYEHGRFRFNEAGIICGYRLNRNHHGTERDTWVKPSHPKYPDNRATARDSRSRDPRGTSPGKTSATDIVVPANDNFEPRSCVLWLKARMTPEHYDAVYDVTAGFGFLHIGQGAGFSSKQAEAVGRDRVLCALRQLARLFTEWDEK